VMVNLLFRSIFSEVGSTIYLQSKSYTYDIDTFSVLLGFSYKG
jgi:hypothetical protein